MDTGYDTEIDRDARQTYLFRLCQNEAGQSHIVENEGIKS